MAHPTQKPNCQNCKRVFYPDHRNVSRQRFCSKPMCRHASKVDSQRRWRQKPENVDYFRGSDNVKRVQLWRQANPGYWRRKTPEGSTEPDALQETFFLQPTVLVGLIAQLSGLALQEDIALMARRLQQLGRDILYCSPHATGGSADAQTPNLFGQAAPSAAAIQLGRPALGP